MASDRLGWQSKLILLLVLPWTAVSVLVQAHQWLVQEPAVAAWTIGLSGALGLLAWGLRSATLMGALSGAVICASLMFSMFDPPFRFWRSGLVPVLAVLVLTSLATRFGRGRKERMGIAEKRQGRAAAQVAANLGMAALIMDPSVQSALVGTRWLAGRGFEAVFALGLAALAEAAADTLSSEIGQVLGGTPRMITTLRRVEPGTDGGVTLAGTVAGLAAAGLVSGAGSLVLHGTGAIFVVGWAGGVFGLLFDSLLGATVERAGWLNNDAVNFLSTGASVAFALLLIL